MKSRITTKNKTKILLSILISIVLSSMFIQITEANSFNKRHKSHRKDYVDNQLSLLSSSTLKNYKVAKSDKHLDFDSFDEQFIDESLKEVPPYSREHGLYVHAIGKIFGIFKIDIGLGKMCLSKSRTQELALMIKIFKERAEDQNKNRFNNDKTFERTFKFFIPPCQKALTEMKNNLSLYQSPFKQAVGMFIQMKRKLRRFLRKNDKKKGKGKH